MLGVGLGLLGAWILPHFISDPITISPAATVGAIVVAIGIGVAFGVYPAGRAARCPPSTPSAANDPADDLSPDHTIQSTNAPARNDHDQPLGTNV